MTKDIKTIDSLDLDNLDEAALMAMTGQGGAPQQSAGLPRLSINYETEDDAGNTLPRGSWRVMLDGQYLYTTELSFRPFARMFNYSLWDSEEGKMTSQSIQTPSLGDRFPDSSGSEKCGRLSKDDEAALDPADPRALLSREVVCNQIVYGTISGDFKSADGTKVKVENEPIVAYFKKSGFRPVREAIDTITRQKKLMAKTVLQLSTKKNKMGSVTFWTPTFAQVDYLDQLTSEDMGLLKKFMETIKGYNDTILAKYRDASKLLGSADSSSLDAELDDVDAA